MQRFMMVLVVLVAASLASCGPNLRRTRRSNQAFDRCFEMDYNPHYFPQDKQACWSHWLREKSYNQPEDKVRYAELRLRELQAGVSVPGPPGKPGSFDDRPAIERFKYEDDQEYEAPPPPGPDDWPPSEASPRVADPDAGPSGESGAGPLPGEGCAESCERRLGECRGACSDWDCESGCADDYKACMRSCYSD